MSDRPEFSAVDWHLFLNTPKVKTAKTIVRRLEKLIGSEIETVSLEPHWKDSTQFVARLRSPIDSGADPAEAVYTFMRTVQLLAHGFSTFGPEIYAEGKVEMSVLSTGGFVESGVTWMHASIANFDPMRS